MMTTFTWTIVNMERAQDDYVTIVHWRVTGDDETNIASAYGTVSFTQEPEETIIPFADLTEEMVWTWVFEKMSKEDTEASIQAELDKLANPPMISGLPW